MRWPEDARDWPLLEHSRIVPCRPHRWHVQASGSGPTLLLIHGAGGATQSFRNLHPLLAETHHVVSVDLPGQGFTQSGARSRSGLDPIAEDLIRLIRAEDWSPVALIGHSAGGAIALRAVEMMDDPDLHVIGINAALMNFRGLAGWLFPKMAKALSLAPFTSQLFAASMTDARARRLIRSTGSDLDDRGIALYRQLASDRAHVDATLAMMSQWSLDGLLSRLDRIANPVTLMVAERDATVDPAASHRAARTLPRATVVSLGPLGHLAHEENAPRVADAIRRALTVPPDQR